jgi:hypothetical protein
VALLGLRAWWTRPKKGPGVPPQVTAADGG